MSVATIRGSFLEGPRKSCSLVKAVCAVGIVALTVFQQMGNALYEPARPLDFYKKDPAPTQNPTAAPTPSPTFVPAYHPPLSQLRNSIPQNWMTYLLEQLCAEDDTSQTFAGEKIQQLNQTEVKEIASRILDMQVASTEGLLYKVHSFAFRALSSVLRSDRYSYKQYSSKIQKNINYFFAHLSQEQLDSLDYKNIYYQGLDYSTLHHLFLSATPEKNAQRLNQIPDQDRAEVEKKLGIRL